MWKHPCHLSHFKIHLQENLMDIGANIPQSYDLVMTSDYPS